MDETIDISHFLEGTPFSPEELSNYLFSNNCCVSLVLTFDKAQQWPLLRTRFIDKRVENIPILWAILFAKSPTQIELLWDIHPMKCFPTLYISNNPNYSKYKIPPLQKNDGGSTLSGCTRFVVNVSGREYPGRQSEYCSAFGLPDDCYDSNFGKKCITALERFKGQSIWFLENSVFLQDNCSEHISKQCMKDTFLPHQYFFYLDSSAQFLSGIFSTTEMADINRNFWYPSGHDFIKERDYHKSGRFFRFEESSIATIKNKVIFELIRLSLLIKNQEKFRVFTIKDTPRFNEERKIRSEMCISKIIAQVKSENEQKFNSTIQSIIPHLNQTLLKGTDFLVLDVEFYSVNYPIKSPTQNARLFKDPRFFKFPCIFSSIYWNSRSRSTEIDINVLNLPCHFCEEPCRENKKHSLKFDCTYFANSFVKKQTTFFEEKLAGCKSLKLFSYGNGDFKQLEYSDNFFINSTNARVYYRRNRKKPLRIIHLAEDISIPDTRLATIEKEILKPWLVGWSRQGNHVNVNKNFSTPFSNQGFKKRYYSAIETCVADSMSTFLYLLHRDYRLNDDPIKVRQNVQATLFNL